MLPARIRARTVPPRQNRVQNFRILFAVTVPLDEIKHLVEQRPPDEQRDLLAWLRKKYPIHELESEFGATAEVILEAISRASDLSRRGVLGLIAEASFKVNFVDNLNGWHDLNFVGDESYDFLISNGDRNISIQVKRQRLAKQNPKLYPRSDGLYVAETQRSRKGVDPKTGEDTRPYRFGEFDILAVCMQPVTGSWESFRLTLGRWLLPRPERADWIKVLQPVSLEVNDDWTDRVETAIRWLDSGVEKTISY